MVADDACNNVLEANIVADIDVEKEQDLIAPGSVSAIRYDLELATSCFVVML